MLRNFRSEGLSSTDIMMLSNNLESDLEALHIHVVDKPAHEDRYQIDEDALREELKNKYRHSRPQQISRDVDSMSDIMRLWRGETFFRLEECRALFVTTNSTLARVTQRYFSDESTARAVSPYLADYALPNLLWLKKPTAAPDLPRKRVIADCYAATQPAEQLWRHYLQEIEKLRQRGEVNADEYYLLRHFLGAETALMDVTMGEEEGFTQGTVQEVLERVRSNIEAKKQSEVDVERASREAAERELESARKRDERRKLRIRSRAQKYTKRVTITLKGAVLLVLLVATAYTFPWDLPWFEGPLGRYAVTLSLFLLFILTVAGLMRGITVESTVRRLEVTLARRLERILLALGEER